MTLITPLTVKRRHSKLHQHSPVAKCHGFPCQHRITATHAKINKRLKLQKRHKLNMWLMIHEHMMRYDTSIYTDIHIVLQLLYLHIAHCERIETQMENYLSVHIQFSASITDLPYKQSDNFMQCKMCWLK